MIRNVAVFRGLAKQRVGVDCISPCAVRPANLEGCAPAQPYVGFLEDDRDFERGRAGAQTSRCCEM